MMCCDICGEEFDDLTVIDEDTAVCDKCLDDNYVMCAHCGCWTEFNSDYYIAKEDRHYCEECFNELFFNCDECSELHSRDEMYITHEGKEICEKCFEDNYRVCTECEEVYSYDEITFVWYNDEPFCYDCFHAMMDKLGLHEYDYSPNELVFHSEEDEVKEREYNPHVGIELEIQGYKRDVFCGQMSQLYMDNQFYMKEDGSLNDGEGVEIVSNPMTYNFIKKEKMYWKKVFQLLNEYDMTDTSGAGLHFHIDRKFCNNRDVAATIEYIVNHFSQYFEQIGGRTFDEHHDYCKKVNKPMTNWGWRNYTRYCAVNLENYDTIELRFCKSTYNYKVFMNRVKMVFGIIYFAKKYSLKDIENWNGRQFVCHFNGICRRHFGSIVKTDLEEVA